MTGAWRMEPGKNFRWEITVRLDSNNAVTIVLPVTEDYASDGAICKGDRRMLSKCLEVTVTGPRGQAAGDKVSPQQFRGKRKRLHTWV